MLGEAGIPHDDATYGGDTGDSSLSVQYWRNKMTEFQHVLNALDETSRAAYEFIAVSTDPASIEGVQAMLNEYEFKKTALRLAAEGVNVAASTINSVGGRFPQLSIPNGLGIAPVALGAGAIAALGAAAALVTWGLAWISGINERMSYGALLQTGDPEVARILARAKAAQALAEQSPISAMSGILKWGAVLVLAFMAWPVVRPMLTGSRN